MGYDTVATNFGSTPPNNPPSSNNPSSNNNNNEPVSLKISYGNEIRRLTIPEATYASLCEKTASLFGIDQSSLVLKYQDDDDDKISMSSDMELQEAVRLSKEMQKVLRLFVEVKAKKIEQPAPVPVVEPKKEEEVYLGPGGGRYGLPRRPSQDAPVPPPHPHHPPFSHSHHPHPHPHPPHSFPPHPPHFYPSYGAWPSSQPPAQEGEGKSHYGPEHHRHHHRRHPHSRGGLTTSMYSSSSTSSAPSSVSSSTSSLPSAEAEQIRQRWHDERKAFKDSKKALKETWKEMKREARTEEERKALKELKEQMKTELRQSKTDFKSDIQYDRDMLRALRLSEKAQGKEKKARLVARHVEDVTIPDGTELPPNTPFIKTWKIRNEGPAWPPGSQLLFVSHKGDNLNGPERVVIKGEVLPGQEVEVSVPLITPNEPGRYVGYYRMVTPDGVKFGQRVWVSFVVKREGEAQPAPTTASSLPISSLPTHSLSNSSVPICTLSAQQYPTAPSPLSYPSPLQSWQQQVQMLQKPPANNDVARMCDNIE